MNKNNYKDNRREIKSGHVIAWSGRGLISNLVRLATRETYSHIGIAWRVSGRLMIIEAIEGKGVQIRPLSELTPFYHIAPAIEWLPNTEKFLMSQVGQKYSYLDAIRGWAGLKMLGSGWQCAKLVKVVAKCSGLNFQDQKTTPGSVVRDLMRLDASVTFIEKI